MAFVPWTPADDSPHIWVEAWDEANRSVASGAISQWTNKGLAAENFSQLVVASRPTLAPAELGGRDAFLFDGSNDVLKSAFSMPSQFIVFLVARQTGQTGGGSILRPVVGCAESNTFSISCERASTRIDFAIGLTRLPFVSNSWPVNETVLLTAKYDGTTLTGYKNGIDQGSVNSSLTDFGPVYIGGDSSALSERRFKGYISAIIIAPITADREKYEGYLAHELDLEGALASDHPYKAQPPGEEVGDFGEISGSVVIDGTPAQRDLIAISYQPQTFEGEETPRRIVVGETISDETGAYTMQTPGFLDEVIVLALDSYGEIWRPNRTYSLGQRIRPTRGNETGYGYDITIAGNSGATEPAWWVPAGGNDTGAIGAATAQAKPLWWSVAHAPILPIPSDPEEEPEPEP